MPEVLKGRVKFFDAKKGYGFIGTDGNKDLFVHWTGIVGPEEYKTLNDNDLVSYEIAQGDRGQKAVNVQKVGN